MSDVLPPSNQEPLPSHGPNVPPKSQAAIERLRKRMEGYRELQTSRLPDYEQTMNQVNSQQMQETLVLRQKYLESKAKKPNKKSSSAAAAAAAEKMKHELAVSGAGPMNGMMQYHGPPPGAGGPGVPQPHNGPPMGPGPNMNGPPMGMNGPPSHNGPMLQNGPSSMLQNHGPNNGQSGHNKRPLEEDSSNIQSDTAKRLNLDNGNISDQNFIKREPSPHETKFNPGAGFGGPGGGGGGHPQPPASRDVKPPAAASASPLPDVKPNVASLKQELGDTRTEAKVENSDSKDDLKAEVSDSVKQEDTLNDLDLNLDFADLGEGLNGETLEDLIGEMGENFDTFDFDNSKIDEKESEGVKEEAASAAPAPSSGSTGPGAGQGAGQHGTPAAETLKLMAQQHQQPPSSQPGQYQGPAATSMPGYQPPSSAMPAQAPSLGPGGQQPHPGLAPEPAANSQSQMMSGPGQQQQRGQEADPRLRAAVSQRFRLGNPNSIANSMSGGGPGPQQGGGMASHPGMGGMGPGHQRMPMGQGGMMGGMQPGQQQPGNMQMMNQQQVGTILWSNV